MLDQTSGSPISYKNASGHAAAATPPKGPTRASQPPEIHRAGQENSETHLRTAGAVEPNSSGGQGAADSHSGAAVAAAQVSPHIGASGHAIVDTISNRDALDRTNPTLVGQGGGQSTIDTHPSGASPDGTPAASQRTKPISASQQEPPNVGQAIYETHSPTADLGGRNTTAALPQVDADTVDQKARETHDAAARGVGNEILYDGHVFPETQPLGAVVEDTRFTDPLIAEIVETWRQRQDMVRAQSKITLQIKAICRRFCSGDKSEADKLYAAIEKGKPHPMADHAAMACHPLFTARQPLEDARKAYEKHLTKLGARLPISHMAYQIRGIGHLALAKIVGECGDLSAYRSVSAVWKRAGLAVIEGERQRRKTDPALALMHGYSPSRRSTFWNIADPMLKAQGKDDAAGPYRKVYDAAKDKALGRGMTKMHAHNHGLRLMTKALVKDLTIEWRALARADQ